MTATAAATPPYRLPVRRLFWLPMGLAGMVAVAVLCALVTVSWRGLERIRPVQAHLAHIGRIQQAGLAMEQVLLQGLRGTHIGLEQLARMRAQVESIAEMGGHLQADTRQRLELVARRLGNVQDNTLQVLSGTLAQLRQVLSDELERHDRMLTAVARDSDTELHLAVILLLTLPLVGGALLLLLRVRIKRPMDNLGDLLRRLADRDYRPVSDLALTGAAGLMQPVFRSYNELVLRLRALEAEHQAREHTLEREVRQATEALLAQSRELARAERLAAVGAVSAGLAHELRNPLAGIQMACTKLRRSLGDQEQSARIEAVIVELKRVNGLLTEKVDAARHAPEPLVAVNLERLVEQFLVLMRYQVPEGITLEARVPSALVCLLPAAGLRQALLNLVLNAVTVLDGRGLVEVAAEQRDERLLIRVSDNGPGFSEEMLRVGVRPFATGRAGGTGLGLAMVRRLVRDLDGELELANRSQGGAVVTLVLPFKPAVADTAGDASHA